MWQAFDNLKLTLATFLESLESSLKKYETNLEVILGVVLWRYGLDLICCIRGRNYCGKIIRVILEVEYVEEKIAVIVSCCI